MKAQDLFLEKIQEDKDFAAKVFDVDNSKEDVQKIAKEAGIEISMEELDKLKEEFLQAADQQEGELSDDDLENVAGGATPTVAATFTIAATSVKLYKERETIKDAVSDGYKEVKKIFSGW